jgi:hypothetical protein
VSYETQGWVLQSQEPVTSPDPEPDQSIAHTHDQELDAHIFELHLDHSCYTPNPLIGSFPHYVRDQFWGLYTTSAVVLQIA